MAFYGRLLAFRHPPSITLVHLHGDADIPLEKLALFGDSDNFPWLPYHFHLAILLCFLTPKTEGPWLMIRTCTITKHIKSLKPK